VTAARYAIGLDFGTNSVRAVVVDVGDGAEIANAVHDYTRGDQGVIGNATNPHVARQHPADYHDGLVGCVTAALEQAQAVAGFSAGNVIGMGVDTTGSTPIPVDRDGVPLAFSDAFRDNENALAWLWKDHSSMAEAEKITALAKEHRPAYLDKSGGTYSSEWFFSKIWHCLNVAPDVFAAARSWGEFCDYIPAILVRDTHEKAHASDVAAGGLCPEWAAKLGLPEGIPVAVGAFDAHYGAVGSGVSDGVLVKILGTSTCDISVAAKDALASDIPGVCGIVDGSVLPGYFGIEAGQSAVGDIFNWFVSVLCEGDASLHDTLSEEAAALKPGESGLLALDWNNGNRTILVDARLTGLLLGQTLQTTRAEVYRALIEATAFGALTIHNRMKEYGVPIDRVICCGGIAEKSPLFMQIYADVTGQTMEVSRSGQTCALGAAIFGAVVAGSAAGGYDTTQAAQAAMTGVKDLRYDPIPENHAIYAELYPLYKRLHDSFGLAGHSDCLGDIMKTLLEISRRVS